MKKIVSLIVILLISMIAFGQSFSASSTITWQGDKYYYFGSDEDISKSVTVYLYVYTDETTFEEYYDDIDVILNRYHRLTNNKIDLMESPENGVYDINENPNRWISIPKELYDLLNICLEYSEETNGLFDITIGKLIDIWKEAIDANLYNVIPKSEFQTLMDDVGNFKNSFPKEDRLLLKIEDDEYYAKIVDDVKLDLGAISKGYAIQKAKEYLISKNVEYYQINAGSSSINLGKFINQAGETLGFNINLTDPFSPFSYYGKLSNIIDASVTTSGNNNQYFIYNGRRYHHIISPITFEPTEGISSVTIIGEDSGALDALSTAAFSMGINNAKAFLNKKGYSYTIYKDDGNLEVNTRNGIIFEENENREKPNIDGNNPNEYNYGNWIIIGIIVVVGLVLLGVMINSIVKITKEEKNSKAYLTKSKENADSIDTVAKKTKLKPTTLRDILMVCSLAVLVIAIFGIYTLWPKNYYDYVRVRRNSELIAEIDYKNKIVYIPDTTENADIEVIYDFETETISLKEMHNGEEHIVMIIGFNFEEKTAWVISADCSDQSCVKTGTIRNSSKTIICLPNGIQIKFEE